MRVLVPVAALLVLAACPKKPDDDTDAPGGTGTGSWVVETGTTTTGGSGGSGGSGSNRRLGGSGLFGGTGLLAPEDSGAP